MTGDKGILAYAPIVRDEVKITVADAAMGDVDLYLVRTQLSWVVAIRQKLAA